MYSYVDSYLTGALGDVVVAGLGVVVGGGVGGGGCHVC